MQHLYECTLNPIPRSGHRIVVDERNMFSVGGYNPANVSSQTDPPNVVVLKEVWRFNFLTKKWKQMVMKGDVPQFLASHTVTLHGNTLVTFGGSGVPFGEQSSNDIHLGKLDLNMDTVTWSCLRCSGDRPERKYGHSQITEWPYLYIVGGTTGFIYNSDVHRLNLQTCHWDILFDSKQSGENDTAYCPEGRYRHEMILYDNKLFMFGGGLANAVYPLDKIPVFSLETMKWEEVETKGDTLAHSSSDTSKGYPSARRCHSCLLFDDRMYLYGGRCNSRIYSDLWYLQLKTLQWHHIPLNMNVTCFFHHAAVSQSGCMYIFGGVVSTDSEREERTNEIHKIWLHIPSLKEMAWLVMSDYLTSSPSLPTRGELLKLGVPRDCAQRV
ncbi:kelch domain-containing protein 10-like isoform X2 [Pomacea canaliculata]|uniref:kelch domain-containing protein 10-like isoform X2 n=1 Tax=Pomacea canaliculata TaxID=400727 RepID=UPI000D72E9B4|nr:kelch domain-containing protein 10-like isoform X2 [Pomacea canaliculata]